MTIENSTLNESKVFGCAEDPPTSDARGGAESTFLQLADIDYFVTNDDSSERRVPGKHRGEFGASRVGLTVGVHYGDEPLTGWLTLDPQGAPIVVITDENGLLVSDGDVRTSDQHVDVAAVTAFIVEIWERLLAGKEVRSPAKIPNSLRQLIEVRAAALGTTVARYIRDLVLSEAHAASSREYVPVMASMDCAAHRTPHSPLTKGPSPNPGEQP
jgi:hypothetical protein